MLRLKGLPVSGKKKELVDRLEYLRTKQLYTEDEYKAKVILEQNGLVGDCGHLVTREHFDDAVSQMGGLKNIFEIFGR